MRFDPGTRKEPAAIIMRALWAAGERDRRICDQQIALSHDELVAGMPERRTLAHLLMQPDPLLPATSVDLAQPARDLKWAGLASQSDHVRGGPGRRSGVEGLPLVACKFTRYTDRPFAPLLAPIGEPVRLAQLVHCQDSGSHGSFIECGRDNAHSRSASAPRTSETTSKIGP